MEDRTDFENENFVVRWWSKDGAWHYAKREKGRKGMIWQAPDDAKFGGYDTKAGAIAAARVAVYAD